MLERAALLASAMVFAGLMPAGAQTSVKTLPAALIGLWGWDQESCAKSNDDGQVTVKLRSVDFYASGYSLRMIDKQQDGSFHANALVSEEGESGKTRGTIELKLVAPGRLLIKAGASEGHIYVRCAAARP
jgi:hypothetical protein